MSHLADPRHSQLRQQIEQREGITALAQRPESKFRNHERMHHNLPSLKIITQLFVSGAEVAYPNRRIGENHRDLRRGIVFNSGIAPPSDANLRALSRSMRALRASRSSAVFSATPVNSCALRTRSSSSATVVLIGNSRH